MIDLTAIKLIRRHVSGDWGDFGAEAKKANDDPIKTGGRIFSSYVIEGDKVWVINGGGIAAT